MSILTSNMIIEVHKFYDKNLIYEFHIEPQSGISNSKACDKWLQTIDWINIYDEIENYLNEFGKSSRLKEISNKTFRLKFNVIEIILDIIPLEKVYYDLLQLKEDNTMKKILKVRIRRCNLQDFVEDKTIIKSEISPKLTQDNEYVPLKVDGSNAQVTPYKPSKLKSSTNKACYGENVIIDSDNDLYHPKPLINANKTSENYPYEPTKNQDSCATSSAQAHVKEGINYKEKSKTSKRPVSFDENYDKRQLDSSRGSSKRKKRSDHSEKGFVSQDLFGTDDDEDHNNNNDENNKVESNQNWQTNTQCEEYNKTATKNKTDDQRETVRSSSRLRSKEKVCDSVASSTSSSSQAVIKHKSKPSKQKSTRQEIEKKTKEDIKKYFKKKKDEKDFEKSSATTKKLEKTKSVHTDDKYKQNNKMEFEKNDDLESMKNFLKSSSSSILKAGSFDYEKYGINVHNEHNDSNILRDVKYLRLYHLDHKQIIARFDEFADYLDNVYNENKNKRKPVFHNGLLVATLVKENDRPPLVRYLQERYETDNDLIKNDDLFFDVLLPEWIMAMFMKEYNYKDRVDAMNQIIIQNDAELTDPEKIKQFDKDLDEDMKWYRNQH